MNGSRLQESTASVKPAAREGASFLGRFALREILSFDPAGIRKKLVPWAMKGGLAILDQGVFTGSNFVISILLARWLSPEQYGSYAVAFAIFLFILTFYQALLLEPMLVFGGSVYRNCLRGYLKALLKLHLGLSLGIVFILAVSAGVALKLEPASSLPSALVGVAFAAPSILLFWLVKRTFYLKLSPAPSAGAAVLYCVLTMGGLAFVYKHGLLSVFSALMLMGVGSLGASASLLIYLKLRLSSSQEAPGVLEIGSRHWNYGRWALGANAMMWVPINLF